MALTERELLAFLREPETLEALVAGGEALVIRAQRAAGAKLLQNEAARLRMLASYGAALAGPAKGKE